MLEMNKQLDALDEPDGDGALQGYELHGSRRPRQLLQV